MLLDRILDLTPEFGIEETIRFRTNISESDDVGPEYRSQLWPAGIREYKLNVKAITKEAMDLIWDFFNARKGAYEDFLIKIPAEYFIEEEPVGSADGSTTQFMLKKFPVDTADYHSVTVGGVATSDYTLSNDEETEYSHINFNSAPASGAILVSYDYYFRVRFKEDKLSRELIAYQLLNSGVILRQVRFTTYDPDYGNSSSSSSSYSFSSSSSSSSSLSSSSSSMSSSSSSSSSSSVSSSSSSLSSSSSSSSSRSSSSISSSSSSSSSSSQSGVPSNDDFANATDLGTIDAINLSGTLVGSTVEAGESGGHVGSIWYKWTAPRSGNVTVTMLSLSPSGAGRIEVFTGSVLNSLTTVSVSSNSSFPMTFAATIGQEYKIKFYHNSTLYSFTAQLSMFAAPSNDSFANAIEISNSKNSLGTNKVTVNGTLLGSTLESGEPVHGSETDPTTYYAANSVWYKWTAPSNGHCMVELYSFDNIHFGINSYAILAVYTGTSIANLTTIAKPLTVAFYGANGNPEFNANLGTTYYIAVVGAKTSPSGSNPAGNFTIILTHAEPPSNDDYANAINFGNNRTVVTQGRNAGATLENYGEPGDGSKYGQRSVWYRWTAAKNGTVSITIQSPTTYLQFGLYDPADVVDNLAYYNSAGVQPYGVGTLQKAGVIAEEEYIIRVSSYRSNTDYPAYSGGDFNLLINLP